MCPLWGTATIRQLNLGKTDKKMHKYLGKTDKLLYICHGKADKIRPFNIRKGDKVSLVNNSGIPIYLLFKSGCF